MGPAGEAAFEEMQNVYSRMNLTATDGVCCAADFLAWAVMVAFVKKEDAKWQLEQMVPVLVAHVDKTWDELQKRKGLLAQMERDEKGDRLQ
jgi:hypothetical protein